MVVVTGTVVEKLVGVPLTVVESTVGTSRTVVMEEEEEEPAELSLPSPAEGFVSIVNVARTVVERNVGVPSIVAGTTVGTVSTVVVRELSWAEGLWRVEVTRTVVE